MFCSFVSLWLKVTICSYGREFQIVCSFAGRDVFLCCFFTNFFPFSPIKICIPLLKNNSSTPNSSTLLEFSSLFCILLSDLTDWWSLFLSLLRGVYQGNFDCFSSLSLNDAQCSYRDYGCIHRLINRWNRLDKTEFFSAEMMRFLCCFLYTWLWAADLP